MGPSLPWLRGLKPGQNPSSDCINSCEIFPKNYSVFRNDRDTLGGGVFIMVHENLVAIEKPEYVTNCEIEWVNLKLKGCKDLLIGSFYRPMPHRNSDTVKELGRSLNLIQANKQKHVILCGDFIQFRKSAFECFLANKN